MKRPLFIIIGIVFVFILIGVWIYILFFNDPSGDSDSYANINLGDTTDTSYTPTDTPDITDQPVVDVTGPERVRQLTTRPVVGYQEVQKTPSSTPLTYYVESGTGHIFSIDLTTGEEKRVSGTTIPSSVRAAVTPNGQYVMIQSGSGTGAEFIIGTFSSTSESISTGLIDEPVMSFTHTSKNTFLYAIRNQSSVVGKEYNPDTQKTNTLFTIPFREAAISWGNTADDPHYIYPKATSELEGYLYQARNNTITRLPIEGYGLSAVGNSDIVLQGINENGSYTTSVFSLKNGTSSAVESLILPEKCTNLNTTDMTFICSKSYSLQNTPLPDSWYKGESTMADDLVLINGTSGSVSYLMYTDIDVGRDLDIINITPNQDDTRFYFKNAGTGNLWLFDWSQ